MMAEKYGGDIDIETKDGRFALTVMLNLQLFLTIYKTEDMNRFYGENQYQNEKQGIYLGGRDYVTDYNERSASGRRNL